MANSTREEFRKKVKRGGASPFLLYIEEAGSINPRTHTMAMKEVKITETKEKEFPNGFASWQETHFEIVSAIADELLRESEDSKVVELYATNGRGAVWELAEAMTDKFEALNKGREWDGEFYDELDEFITKEFNEA
jgi:hypothetical protein